MNFDSTRGIVIKVRNHLPHLFDSRNVRPEWLRSPKKARGRSTRHYSRWFDEGGERGLTFSRRAARGTGGGGDLGWAGGLAVLVVARQQWIEDGVARSPQCQLARLLYVSNDWTAAAPAERVRGRDPRMGRGEGGGPRGYVARGEGERRGWVWKACFVWKQCRYSATSSSPFFALTQRRTEKGCLYSSLIKVIGYFRSVSHTAKFVPTDFLANPHAASCLLDVVHFFW